MYPCLPIYLSVCMTATKVAKPAGASVHLGMGSLNGITCHVCSTMLAFCFLLHFQAMMSKELSRIPAPDWQLH